VQRACRRRVHLIEPAQDLVDARAALSGGFWTFYFLQGNGKLVA
jgi:hypothetical protein